MQSLTGTWSGMLSFPSGPLLFVIRFAGDGKSLSATAASPYQGAQPIPVDTVSISARKLTFAIRKLEVAYEGWIGANSVSGTFTQRGVSVPLVLIPSALGTSHLAGIWLGNLSVSGNTLLVALKLVKRADGTMTGSVDSPYQGSFDIPVNGFKTNGRDVEFTVPSINASFKGTVGTTAISGTYTQDAQDLPLTFARP